MLSLLGLVVAGMPAGDAGLGVEGEEVAMLIVWAEVDDGVDVGRGIETMAEPMLLDLIEGMYGCNVGGQMLDGRARNARTVLKRNIVLRPPKPARRVLGIRTRRHGQEW